MLQMDQIRHNLCQFAVCTFVSIVRLQWNGHLILPVVLLPLRECSLEATGEMKMSCKVADPPLTFTYI